MKKLIAMLWMCVLLLTSCEQVITNTADEVRLNRWSAKLGGGRVASLSFTDDYGCFKISSKEKRYSVKISGLAFIDKKSIALFDGESGYPYRFNYSINENKLKLSTAQGAITLTSQR